MFKVCAARPTFKRFFMSKFSKIAAVAVLAAGSAASMASTIDLGTLSGLSGVGGTLSLGTLDPVTNTYVYTNENAGAYELQFSPVGTGSFAAYCIDISTVLQSPPGLYNVSPTPPVTSNLSLAQITTIGKLFTAAGFKGNDFANDGVDTTRKAAALQLAIWEVVYDGYASVGGLDGGAFKATFSNATVNAYNGLVGSLRPETLASSVAFYTSIPNGRSQNLVSSIPEPSTYALLAACLGVVGLVAKRKQEA
jgi:PEP-CTERM motif